MADTATGTAAADRFQLGGMWFAYGTCMAVFTWLAAALGGAPGDVVQPLVLAAGACGIALGLYERYRSRFGVATRLVRAAMGGLLLGLMAPATAVMAADVVVLHSPVSPAGLGLVVAVAMGVVLGLGAARARGVIRAQAGDAEPAWLRERVDLARDRLLDTPDAATPARPTWRMNLALLLMVAAINVPLLFASPDRVRGLALLVVAPLMCVAAGQLAYVFGQSMAYLVEIDRWSRARGRTIVGAHLEELRALRRRFWLRRVLCRAEDR